MTEEFTHDTSPAADDPLAELRAEIRALTLRLDALEARSAAAAGQVGPGVTDRLAAAADTAAMRAGAAWAALRGRPTSSDEADRQSTGVGSSASAQAVVRPGSGLAALGMVILALLAALLAFEVVEEAFKGLRHFLRWVF